LVEPSVIAYRADGKEGSFRNTV